MNKDIIIVDDDDISLDTYCLQAEIKGLNPIRFQDFSEALLYLPQRDEPAAGYLVDMRPADIYEQGKLPEEIFNYVKESWPIDNFYFMTGHLSDHDEGVLARTGAKHFLKNGELSELTAIFEAMLQS